MKYLILPVTLLLTFSASAFAQDAVPQRQYKLQQPGLREQLSQLRPIEPTHLNQAQINLIAEQIMHCWKAPQGAIQKNLVVDLQITYNQDGTPNTIELAADKALILQDADFLNAVKAAMDAVRQCSPLQGVTNIPYENWQHFELVFAPQTAQR